LVGIEEQGREGNSGIKREKGIKWGKKEGNKLAEQQTNVLNDYLQERYKKTFQEVFNKFLIFLRIKILSYRGLTASIRIQI